MHRILALLQSYRGGPDDLMTICSSSIQVRRPNAAGRDAARTRGGWQQSARGESSERWIYRGSGVTRYSTCHRGRPDGLEHIYVAEEGIHMIDI